MTAPASIRIADAPRPAASTATAVLTALLEARAGQTLSSERAWRIETALKPLIHDCGLASADELVARLLGNRDPAIGDRIVEALLNGETSFFRDPAVFEAVAEAIASADRPGHRLRVWSAGCSTGQEPLSLAMLFAERAAAAGAAMPDIVATDLSAAALTRAVAGLYTQFEIQRGLPIGRALRWFEAQPSSEWLAAPELRRAIDYRRLNLVDDDWPIGRFDAILCRNVLLYLAPALKPALFERFAAALRPGGMLVLGAGETVIGQTRLFEPCRRFRGVYRRAGEGG